MSVTVTYDEQYPSMPFGPYKSELIHVVTSAADTTATVYAKDISTVLYVIGKQTTYSISGQTITLTLPATTGKYDTILIGY